MKKNEQMISVIVYTIRFALATDMLESMEFNSEVIDYLKQFGEVQVDRREMIMTKESAEWIGRGGKNMVQFSGGGKDDES